MTNCNISNNYKQNFIVRNLLTASFILLLSGNAISMNAEDTGSNVPTSIYLCTKDIDDSPSGLFPTPQEKTEEFRRNNAACNASSLAYSSNNSRPRDYVFIPYYDGSECHYFLRHCFLVQATKLGEDTINGKKLLRLKYLDSRGFGGDDEDGATTYSEYIFEKDQYKNRIISCNLVFDKNNLTDGELQMYGNAKGAMNHKWAEVTTFMENEVDAGYDACSHNCCSVAYKALEKINPNIWKIVDPMEINYGIGVIFTGVSGAISASVVNTAKKVDGSSEKKGHDEL